MQAVFSSKYLMLMLRVRALRTISMRLAVRGSSCASSAALRHSINVRLAGFALR
jgi:hypothetical protein